MTEQDMAVFDHQVVLLDLDGTISDNSSGIVAGVRQALKVHAPWVVETADVTTFIGPPLRTMFSTLGVPDHAVEDAVSVYREYYDATGWAENVLYDGVGDLIERLAASGRTVATATSKPEPFASRILGRFGLADLFDHIGAATLDGSREHKADVVTHTIETLGVAGGECVMIGDRWHDVEGARAAGVVSSIGVTWGFGDRDELNRAGAGLVVDTVDQLASALSIGPSNVLEN